MRRRRLAEAHASCGQSVVGEGVSVSVVQLMNKLEVSRRIPHFASASLKHSVE